MQKVEKFKSFEEMKASSKPIDPSNVAEVMERHEQMKQSLVSMRQDLLKHKSSSKNINKPVN